MSLHRSVRRDGWHQYFDAGRAVERRPGGFGMDRGTAGHSAFVTTATATVMRLPYPLPPPHASWGCTTTPGWSQGSRGSLMPRWRCRPPGTCAGGSGQVVRSRPRRRRQLRARSLQRLPQRSPRRFLLAEVLHVDNHAVAHPEHLVLPELLVGRRDAPPQLDHDALVLSRDDLRGGVGDLATRLASGARNAMFEDFTSLVGTASTGRLAPPEVTTIDAPPFHVRGEEGDKRLDVASNRSIQRRLHPLTVRAAHRDDDRAVARRRRPRLTEWPQLPTAPCAMPMSGSRSTAAGRHPIATPSPNGWPMACAAAPTNVS
jgi:hypothetical protein